MFMRSCDSTNPRTIERSWKCEFDSLSSKWNMSGGPGMRAALQLLGLNRGGVTVATIPSFMPTSTASVRELTPSFS